MWFLDAMGITFFHCEITAEHIASGKLAQLAQFLDSGPLISAIGKLFKQAFNW